MSRAAVKPPYRASWFNRYLDWVDRLPIPLWLYYILLYIAAVLLLHLSALISREASFGQISPELIVGGIWLVLESGTVHYLDKVGRAQMQKFRPLLESDEVFEDLDFRIQKMPARPVFIITALLGVAIFISTVLDPLSASPEGSSPIIAAATAIILFIEYITSPVYIYHAFHQLGVVRKAYALSGQISLFNLGTLRSLSVVSARTGNALFLLFALNYVQNILLSGGLSVTAGIAVGSLFLSIAILVFVLPLRDVHDRVQAKKEQALEENGKITEATIAEMQSRLAKTNLKESKEFNQALSGLFKVRDEIAKISPWPWQPETLRSFLSAILLPVLLILIQQIISRLI